jgi:hypothetical protein
MEAKIMHFKKLLETYDLDPDIFDITRLTGETGKPVASDKHNIHISDSGSSKTDLNVNCYNCIYFKADSQSAPHTCALTHSRVADYRAPTECISFQRGRCSDCGFYETGVCTFRDNEIPKKPDDTCEYNMEDFE